MTMMRMMTMTECSTKEVGIDIETRSSADLVKYGVYAYADSPDFEILLIAYTTDTGVELIDLKQGDDPTEFLDILKNPKIIKTAYNANFERTCLAKYFGIACPPEEWRCTAVLASQLGLPRSLQKVGEAIGLPEDEKKLKIGKSLISFFCKPQRPTKSNGGRIWNDPEHDQDKWELFKIYCKQDVVTEQAIRQKLIRFAPNESEQELWNLDQRINDRGVRIDLDLADIVVRETEIRSKVLEVKARELSGLENPNSLVQVKAWLKSYGIEVESLNKDALKELLKQELPSNVREFLKIRQVSSLSSVKKYQTMQAMTCKDGYCRGMMQFYGGHTGRWAGRGLQPQNLTKNEVTLKELDIARKLVKADDMEGLELLFDEPTQMFKQLIRTAFIPSEGRRFIVTDFAAIEARVIAALASENNWRLEVFRSGGDIYCESASRMFGVPVEKHGINGHLRAQGKIAELGLGYQGGRGAILSFDKDGAIPEDKIDGIVSDWREASPFIVKLWYKVEECAIKAVRTRTKQVYRGLVFKSGKIAGFDCLRVKLLSGRCITYFDVKLIDGKYGPSLTYMHSNQTTGKWERTETYGGKCVENLVQSIARDCLAEKMKIIAGMGYDIAFHVHDEMIVDVPIEDDKAFKLIDDVMAEPIEWMPNLPLRGSTYACDYYVKD
jgi:DNA polymerase